MNNELGILNITGDSEDYYIMLLMNSSSFVLFKGSIKITEQEIKERLSDLNKNSNIIAFNPNERIQIKIYNIIDIIELYGYKRIETDDIKIISVDNLK